MKWTTPPGKRHQRGEPPGRGGPYARDPLQAFYSGEGPVRPPPGHDAGRERRANPGQPFQFGRGGRIHISWNRWGWLGRWAHWRRWAQCGRCPTALGAARPPRRIDGGDVGIERPGAQRGIPCRPPFGVRQVARQRVAAEDARTTPNHRNGGKEEEGLAFSGGWHGPTIVTDRTTGVTTETPRRSPERSSW